MDDSRKDRILLVDDEKHLVISLRDYLTFENFEVTTARSGEEALKKLEKAEPDLIILDISMPGMGGVGFLKRISSDEGKPRYPVLVHTARAAMAEFFDTVEVDGFIGKPSDETELVNKIREIIAKRRGGTEKKPERTKRKILIAEDDPRAAGILSKDMVDAGYEIEIVESGPEVLEKAAKDKPDVILMKEILPKLNGSAVASLIEVMPSINMVPVVLYDESRTGAPGASRHSDLKCVKRFLTGFDSMALLKAIKEVL